MSTSNSQKPLTALPITPSAWRDFAETRGVENSSINDIDDVMSASKITDIQFLTLRAICPKTLNITEGAEYFKARLCTTESYELAKLYLKNDNEWIAYLADIDQSPTKSIGLYSMVRYYQNAIIKSETKEKARHLKEMDNPIDFADPKFKWSPISNRTRSHIGNLGLSPTPAAPVTPPRAGNFGKAGGPPRHALQPGHEDASPWYGSSSNRSSGGASGEPTPYSPALAGFSPVAEDEQIVNTAILLLLNTLTAYHPAVGSMEWTMKRKVFRCGPSEARTDGYLRDKRQRTRAIIEVKPFVRNTNNKAIQMQEAAQLAAWNASEEPHEGTTVLDKNGIFRRLLISQDSVEIYLTVSEFNKQYVDYIRGDRHTGTPPHSFMRLNTMGPWMIGQKNHMRDLSYLLLAFTLHQSKLVDRPEAADPFTSASTGTAQELPFRPPPGGKAPLPGSGALPSTELLSRTNPLSSSSRTQNPARPQGESSRQAESRSDRRDKNDNADTKDKKEKRRR